MIDRNSQFMAILTNVGAAKLADANALGIPWNLTALGVGDANGTDPVPSATQTKLINEQRRAPLNQLRVDPVNAAVIIAEQVIPADVGGWWIREIGLYDSDGDLVAVSNCAPSFKPALDQGSGRTQIVRMNFIVSSINNIVLKIDPAIVLATREYVDLSIADALNKQDFKHSVLVATTANIALSGLQTVDGMVLAADDRVLVKDQAQAKNNGIYVVSTAGAWKRAQDADVSVEVTPGLFVAVEKGTTHGDSVWQLVTDAPIVLGTTALTFEVIAGRTGIAAGTYRSLTVDKLGRVIAGTNPTTLAGSGITDGATKTELSDAVGGLLPKSGGQATGSIIMNNGTEDSPEFGFKTPTVDARIDVFNKAIRIFASYNGNSMVPLSLNLDNKDAYLFGKTLWHTGNFNPDVKVNGDGATSVGFASGNVDYPYIWSTASGGAVNLQKRLGYTPVQQGGGVGQATNKIYIGWSSQGLKATVDNSDLGLLWCENNFKPSDYIKLGQYVPVGYNPAFQSTGFGSIAGISGGGGTVQINGGDGASSAVMCFHRPSAYGVMFGLDTDNQLKLGGWSAGAVAHTIWHSGNRPKDTALLETNGWSKNADTGEINQWVEYAIGDTPGTTSVNVSWKFQFPNRCLNVRPSIALASGAQGAIGVSVSAITAAGCTVRIEEWAAVVQTGMVLMVEARGF